MDVLDDRVGVVGGDSDKCWPDQRANDLSLGGGILHPI
jgi:hypothetical protein